MLQKYTFIFLLTIASLVLHAQKAAVYQKNGYAINGYDAVAFFTEQKPVKGNETFVFKWNDASWLFSNEANMDSFKKAPEKYAPQYGGYCAYGTADGHKAPTETGTWTIVNDKLYFNYNNAVKKMWMANQPALIEKADANWPKIRDSE